MRVTTVDFSRVLVTLSIAGTAVTVDVMHGGGYVPSTYVVRLAGRVLAVARPAPRERYV